MSVVTDAIEWEECFLEPQRDPEVEAQARRELGRVPLFLAYYTGCPWLVRALYRNHFTRGGVLLHTDFDLADLLFLAVSHENSCRFCYDTQRALMRLQGLSEARIRELERDFSAASRAPRERAALEFARKIARAHPLPTTADMEPLREVGYSEPMILEIAFVASLSSAGNRMATLVALPREPFEQLPGRWWMRPLLPLIAGHLRGQRRRGAPGPLSEEQKRGPYACAYLACDGLPAARVGIETLRDAWESPILPRRTKALVFAVVARTLGCKPSEAEGARLAKEQGIDAPRLEAILSHLASPELDPIEAAVVPFARETVWYQPAAIQRRGRELRQLLTREQFLELIGVAALANGVCRLGFLANPG